MARTSFAPTRVPPAVAQEPAALSHAAARDHITTALGKGWLTVEQPPIAPPPLPFRLDPGETEAIVAALGELLYARQTGLLSNLRIELNRLRSEAGFFLDAEIERFILSQVGE